VSPDRIIYLLLAVVLVVRAGYGVVGETLPPRIQSGFLRLSRVPLLLLLAAAAIAGLVAAASRRDWLGAFGAGFALLGALTGIHEPQPEEPPKQKRPGTFA